MSCTRREFMTQSAAMLASARIAPSLGPPVSRSTARRCSSRATRSPIAAGTAPSPPPTRPAPSAPAIRYCSPRCCANETPGGTSRSSIAGSAEIPSPTSPRGGRPTPSTCKPAILSILIGVNDVWHTLGKTPANEVVTTYEAGYHALLDRTRAALPGVKIVVLEPFALRTGSVNDTWFPEFDQLRAACRRVADRAHAQFVGLHDMFQKRAARSSPAYWAADGVHPTAAGHQAIAEEWIGVVKPSGAAFAALLLAAPLAAQGARRPADSAVVILLGTGTPRPDPDASGAATAVVVGSRTFLFDAGPGVELRLSAAGLPINGPTAVFITHLHSDHTLGLPDLIFTSWVMGRARPMPIYGPHGLAAMVDDIDAAWSEDIAIRTDGLEHETAGGYRTTVHEIAPGVVYDSGGVKVTAIPVLHGDWKEAYGYRIDTPTRSIVISGDTRPCPALADAARGVDILIHEVYPAAKLAPEQRPGGGSRHCCIL